MTTTRFGNHLFENRGGGKFRDVTENAGLAYSGHSSSVTFFDYDNDGLLDIILCNTGRFTNDEKGPGGFYRAVKDAFMGHLYADRTEHSRLYKNEGGLRFREVSKEMGLVDNAWSGDAVAVDLNGDLFVDVYVVNMQGDDHYYENQGGKRFKDKTAQFFPKTPWGSMGVTAFDYNLDGRVDLFVTDMHSDMTTLQTELGRRDLRRSFDKEKSEAWCSQSYTESVLQGASNNIFGNAFFANRGNGKFDEISDTLGVESYWPWGPSVGDLNADGYEDLLITAGMGYPYRYGINSLLLNSHGTQFLDAELLLRVEPRSEGMYKLAFTLDCDDVDRNHPGCSGRSGPVEIFGALSSRSAAVFDLDDDGDLDIVTSENSDHPQILISNLTERQAIHYLKVKLIGSTSNRDGLGATVSLHAGGKVQTRYNHGKSGYLSQSRMPLYFGLGSATQVDRIEVLWPSGRKDSLKGPAAVNRLIEIRETR